MLDVKIWKNKMKYIYLLCLSILFINCNNRVINKDEITYPDVFEYIEKDTVITYERTRCYGTCPAYRVIIFGDGDIYYTGIANVKTIGNRHSKLSKTDINRILQKTEEISFFELRKYYPDEIESNIILVTDATFILTSIKIGNKFEKISRYIGNELSDNIDFVNTMKELEACIEDVEKIRQYVE